MKTTNLNFAKMALYLFMGLSITLVSCSGEDGEMGPQGPPGKDGVNGTNGIDGQDGNANVVASDWQLIQWDEPVPDLGEMFIETPEVNIGDFVESGSVVLVYLKYKVDTYNYIHMLPFSLETAFFDFYIKDTPTENGIVVRMADPGLNVLNIQNDETFMLRYILIPANVAETSGIADKMPQSFGEAAALLGLDH
ncbi:collagen-like protein [Muricauda sp. NFXS6]|uniref:hypothetical protein n=1 Tax=Allomuricauda sp. NFXS6 TaxID=2819094 RepID=UPI0032DEC2E4